MKVVTTVHKAGFEQYGQRWIDSLPNWPTKDVCMYAEGFEPEGVQFKNIDAIERVKAFKEQMKGYKAPNWRYDIVRFCHKVFVAYDAFYDHDGIGVWLDCDAVTYKPVPPGYVESQLDGAYLAHFKRAGHYTETGLWIVDCTHPMHKQFFDKWLWWFESGAFKALHEWHDCTTLDATIRAFKDDIRTVSLSGAFERDMHPMALADFGRFVDHCKGPRKAIGHSPENQHRKAQ